MSRQEVPRCNIGLAHHVMHTGTRSRATRILVTEADTCAMGLRGANVLAEPLSHTVGEGTAVNLIIQIQDHPIELTSSGWAASSRNCGSHSDGIRAGEQHGHLLTVQSRRAS